MSKGESRRRQGQRGDGGRLRRALWAKRSTWLLTLSEVELRDGSEQNFLLPEVNHSHPFVCLNSTIWQSWKNQSHIWPHP